MFTFSAGMLSSFSAAIVTAENASLISNRSTSETFQPRLLQELPDRADRRQGEPLRLPAERGRTDDPRLRLQPNSWQASCETTSRAAAPSLMLEALAGGHRALGAERRLRLRSFASSPNGGRARHLRNPAETHHRQRPAFPGREFREWRAQSVSRDS